MRIRLLDSAISQPGCHQFLMSLLVNDFLVIDAGSIGFTAPLDVQRKVRHLFLTHSHLDHIASLAIFLDNVYVPSPECPTIHASVEVQDCLKKDIFNGRVWPDLNVVSKPETPFFQLQSLEHLQPVEVERHRVTPVSLDHVVPTLGFVVEDDKSAFALVSDTSPTDAIWDVANANEKLKLVFLETSFPNRMSWLAERSMHLTPALMKDELKKLKRDVPVIIVHTKAAFQDEVRSEIADLKLSQVELVQPDRIYEI